jgi:hypothetical protein
MNQIFDLLYEDEKWFPSMNLAGYVIYMLCGCPIRKQHII